MGTSLAVQWLRLHTSNAGGTDWVPGWRTKIPYAAWLQKKKKNIYIYIYIYKIEQNPKLGTCCLKIIELHSWKEALKL